MFCTAECDFNLQKYKEVLIDFFFPPNFLPMLFEYRKQSMCS